MKKANNVVFLCETKLPNVGYFGTQWFCGFQCVLCLSVNDKWGGLAVWWKGIIYLSLLHYSPNHIDMQVSGEVDCLAWRFTRVYKEPRVSGCGYAWTLLCKLQSRSSSPWICIGNFKEILWSFEKLNGNYNVHDIWTNFGSKTITLIHFFWSIWIQL